MSSPSTVVLVTGKEHPFIVFQPTLSGQGANSGIGYATTRLIASSSSTYHVIMTCRSAEKGSVSSIQLDVSDQSSIEAAAKTVEERFGVLDVLVNNAGIYSKAPDLKTQLETTLNTNTVGAALASHTFRPLLLQSKRAYLIHIGSALGSMTEAADPDRFDYHLQATAYRMSKAAINMQAVQDSKELGTRGVKVFVVCPGLVRSALRGDAEAEISAGGAAVDPIVSAQLILSIVEGQRDADVGKFVHKDGVDSW